MKKPFYITTTLPYVNAEPHMGHALEFIRADIIARWKLSQGYDVFFNTGTDEHGQKLFEAAQKAGVPVQKYVDDGANHFKNILKALNISEEMGSPKIHFIRTTDKHHEKAAQEFWKRVAAKTDDKGQSLIYKKNYKTKYCVGCEEEKTDSELVDGRCPIHSNRELEVREEENYFFRFSSFGPKLLELYEGKGGVGGTFRVIPDFRFNEMKEFVKNGLEDFSISRLKSKMAWGVAVPGDADHVMYVWFDALVNYISTLGWPEDKANFERFWRDGTPTQYCGKDNTRFQSVMWQAMLIAADLPSTHTVVVNGFVTGEGGVKMSKSLGNTINPMDIVNEYGADALRYFVAREIGSFEDSPFTIERFKASYNSGLANGLGNLVSRVMKMATTYGVEYSVSSLSKINIVDHHLFNFDIKGSIDSIFAIISSTDKHIEERKPFKLIKTNPEEAKEIIRALVVNLYLAADRLSPIMPETAKTIQSLIRENKMPEKPLFLRKD